MTSRLTPEEYEHLERTERRNLSERNLKLLNEAVSECGENWFSVTDWRMCTENEDTIRVKVAFNEELLDQQMQEVTEHYMDSEWSRGCTVKSIESFYSEEWATVHALAMLLDDLEWELHEAGFGLLMRNMFFEQPGCVFYKAEHDTFTEKTSQRFEELKQEYLSHLV